MTLPTRYIEAGWHEVEWGTRFIAEKFHAQPGATSTVLREEGTSQDDLHKRLDLRESQLSNDQDIVVYPQDRVSDSQHSANQILGVVPAPEPTGVVVPDRDPSADTTFMASDEEIAAGHEASAAVLEAGAVADTQPPDGKVFTESSTVATAPAVLSDEERAKLRSDEDELEDGKIDAVEPPTDPGLVGDADPSQGGAEGSTSTSAPTSDTPVPSPEPTSTEQTPTGPDSAAAAEPASEATSEASPAETLAPVVEITPEVQPPVEPEITPPAAA